MSPLYRVLPPNACGVWLNRTRLSQSADFAFAASKRTAKTEIFLRNELIELSNGDGAPWIRCSRYGIADEAKNLAKKFFKKFLGDS